MTRTQSGNPLDCHAAVDLSDDAGEGPQYAQSPAYLGPYQLEYVEGLDRVVRRIGDGAIPPRAELNLVRIDEEQMRVGRHRSVSGDHVEQGRLPDPGSAANEERTLNERDRTGSPVSAVPRRQGGEKEEGAAQLVGLAVELVPDDRGIGSGACGVTNRARYASARPRRPGGCGPNVGANTARSLPCPTFVCQQGIRPRFWIGRRPAARLARSAGTGVRPGNPRRPARQSRPSRPRADPTTSTRRAAPRPLWRTRSRDRRVVDDEDQDDELAKQATGREQAAVLGRWRRPNRPLRLTAPRLALTTTNPRARASGRAGQRPYATYLGACIPRRPMVFLPSNRVKARFALRP